MVNMHDYFDLRGKNHKFNAIELNNPTVKDQIQKLKGHSGELIMGMLIDKKGRQQVIDFYNKKFSPEEN